MTTQYGIIGYPLGHSFSPAFFQAKFAAEGIDARYSLYPIESIDGFTGLLQNQPGLRGLNVTIPYKEAIIRYLSNLTTEAREVGAVNCIAINNGVTTGHNTDIIGFERSLTPLLQNHHTAALVLGTGGASKAVIYVLKKLGIDYSLVSRTKAEGTITYGDLSGDIVSKSKLIINTTPLGMHPHTSAFPALPYENVGAEHLLYDLIYNPAETRFLKIGREHGATTKNGLEMLELQAIAGWKIWTTT